MTLDELCVGRDETPEQVRAHLLAGYLCSDGAEMVPADLLDLADRAEAAEEWVAYPGGTCACARCGRTR